MTQTDFKIDLSVLVRARCTVIYVNTFEEIRAFQSIYKIAEQSKRSVYTFTATRGLYSGDFQEDVSNPLDALDVWNDITKNTASILVLPDFHAFFGNPNVVRKVKEYSASLRSTYKTIIIVSPVINIPVEISKETSLIEMDYPDYATIRTKISDNFRSCNGLDVLFAGRNQDQVLDELSRASAGLTTLEIDDIIGKSVATGKLDVRAVVSQKKQIIKKSGLLEYYDTEDFSIGDIGGLDLLKSDIKRDKKRFSSKARDYGLEQPKSRLCIGSPGTGKSLSVKAIAAELGIPLVRLAAGNISSKYYGETTNLMKQALKLALAISPCVLWLDEIEKMLSSGEGGSGVHEETSRALSELLTFMEESAGIYFIGTCNDHRTLKPELLQRFEKIDFVDLPGLLGREEIFSIHLKKFRRDPAKFDIKRFSEISEGFSGREIRIVVKEALSRSFDDNERELTSSDVIDQITRTTPTSRSRMSEIEELRNWARANCLMASSETRTVHNNADQFGENRFQTIEGNN